MAHQQELLQVFDDLLCPQRFKDYGPNGLQVEGKQEVRCIVSGVTASLALIEAAVQAQADAIFVHHGPFWRGQDGRVTGWMKRRQFGMSRQAVPKANAVTRSAKPQNTSAGPNNLVARSAEVIQ